MAISRNLKVGDTVFYNRKLMTVTRDNLPGEYGARVELGGRIVTTPALDCYLTETADEPFGPTLTEVLYSDHDDPSNFDTTESEWREAVQLLAYLARPS